MESGSFTQNFWAKTFWATSIERPAVRWLITNKLFSLQVHPDFSHLVLALLSKIYWKNWDKKARANSEFRSLESCSQSPNQLTQGYRNALWALQTFQQIARSSFARLHRIHFSSAELCDNWQSKTDNLKLSGWLGGHQTGTTRPTTISLMRRWLWSIALRWLG